jgi:hypothetical protein
MKQESVFWTGFLALIFIVPFIVVMCGPCFVIREQTPGGQSVQPEER